MYAFRSTHGTAERQVDLAFTDRLGGVSRAPYDSLNLAISGDDSVADRQENLRLLMADFAPRDRLVDLTQVHGATVFDGDRTGAGGRPEADAVLSVLGGTTLMVRAADCVPVLLADPRAGVVGAAHCGRSGLTAEVVPALVARMRESGADRLTAWIGPHVCGGCYEVPEELQEQVAAVVPSSRAQTTWGTPALDLGAGVRSQLETARVAVVDVARCTRESADLYSHRRDGAGAGRHAGVIRIRP